MLILSSITALASRGIGNSSRDLQKGLIALPVRQGGLRIPSYARLAAKLHIAAKEAARPLLEQIQPDIYSNLEPNSTILSAREVLTEENAVQLQALKLSSTQENARLENASYFGRQ